MLVPFAVVERSVAELVGETDVEALTAEQVVETMVERSTRTSRSRAPSRRRRASCSTCSSSIEPKARVFALDTHVLFPETYACWREVEQRYGIADRGVRGPVARPAGGDHGEQLWERKPDLCCSIRKVEPLGAALSGLDCWITGVRRDQSPTRADAPKLGWDDAARALEGEPARRLEGRRRLGLHPRSASSPYNALHDRGYASIGCTHCTAPGTGREGRWAGSDKTECGLHA